MSFFTGIVCCKFDKFVAEKARIIVPAKTKEAAEQRLKDILLEEHTQSCYLAQLYGPFSSMKEAVGPFLQLN